MESAQSSKEWTGCLGFHVRSITIIFGLWHLNSYNFNCLMHEYKKFYDYKDYIPSSSDPDAPDVILTYHDIDVIRVMYVLLIAICLLLIFGAVKFKPLFLLPFFCVQLFDFAITILTAAGYFCYLRLIHRVIDNSYLWTDMLLRMNPRLSVLIFMMVAILKGYVIGIVWRCYKYLTIRQLNSTRSSVLPYVVPPAAVSTMHQECDYKALLPNYEEAIAQSMKQQSSNDNAHSVPPAYVENESDVINIATTSGLNSNRNQIDNNNFQMNSYASTAASESMPPQEPQPK